MDQKELASELGVGEGTVSGWVAHGVYPKGQQLLRLPHILGCDGHWLLTGQRSDEGLKLELVRQILAVTGLSDEDVERFEDQLRSVGQPSGSPQGSQVAGQANGG